MEPGLELLFVSKSELVYSVTGAAHWQAGLPVSHPTRIYHIISLKESKDDPGKLYKEPVVFTTGMLAPFFYLKIRNGLALASQFIQAVPLHLKHCFLLL